MDKNKFTKQKRGLEISPARVAAFEILLKIEKEKSYSSILLPVYEEKLNEKDSSLCHEITLGVLRKQIYLDKIISHFADKKIDLEVKIALRLGLYQLLFLDRVPDYSAINDSVNLVVRAKKTSAKGFVNAILRRTTREKIAFEYSSELEKVSVETSHPIWLLEKWIAQFGSEEVKKLAEANNQTPAVSFRSTAKTTEAVKNNLQNPVIDKSFLRDLAKSGKIYFQDDGSQLIGKLVDLGADQLFLDVCAAPGSKFTQVATSSRQEIFGGDLYFQRLQTIRKSADKQGVSNISLVQYDAEQGIPFLDEAFDIVLVDAPCSGTGTIRHNPEIRYSLAEKDFSGLASKQLKILNNASKLVKKGGKLIYSTCSLECEENEEVVNKFLLEGSDFLLNSKFNLPELITENGFIRTFPHRDSMDGFFIAVLQKI